MSWQNRPYSSGPYTSGPSGMGGWLGGLPAPGRAVKGIMLANAAVFVLCMLSGGLGDLLFGLFCMRTDLVLRGQVWRLFTFAYLHAGLFHILFNMIGLYFLGMYLERHLGARRFFVFYTVGGFLAALAFLLVCATGWLSADAPLVGASGGVLAVVGACAVLFPSIQLILVLFPVPIRLAVTLFAVIYAVNLLTRGANAGGDACHLAGLAFGIAWGYRGQSWASRWNQFRGRFKQGAWEAKMRRRHEEDQEVDRILAKINEQGVNSLTRGEKRLLADVTRQRQEEDRDAGL